MAKGIMVMRLGQSKLRIMSELCDDKYSDVEEILFSQSHAAQRTEEISSTL
jgi:hypothetical protein